MEVSKKALIRVPPFDHITVEIQPAERKISMVATTMSGSIEIKLPPEQALEVAEALTQSVRELCLPLSASTNHG